MLCIVFDFRDCSIDICFICLVLCCLFCLCVVFFMTSFTSNCVNQNLWTYEMIYMYVCMYVHIVNYECQFHQNPSCYFRD